MLGSEINRFHACLSVNLMHGEKGRITKWRKIGSFSFRYTTILVIIAYIEDVTKQIIESFLL
jgi:hypothetical protein